MSFVFVNSSTRDSIGILVSGEIFFCVFFFTYSVSFVYTGLYTQQTCKQSYLKMKITKNFYHTCRTFIGSTRTEVFSKKGHDFLVLKGWTPRQSTTNERCDTVDHRSRFLTSVFQGPKVSLRVRHMDLHSWVTFSLFMLLREISVPNFGF